MNRVQLVEGSKSGPRSFVDSRGDLFVTCMQQFQPKLLSDRAQDSKQDSNGKNARDTWRHVNTRDPLTARLPIPSPILALVIQLSSLPHMALATHSAGSRGPRTRRAAH